MIAVQGECGQINQIVGNPVRRQCRQLRADARQRYLAIHEPHNETLIEIVNRTPSRLATGTLDGALDIGQIEPLSIYLDDAIVPSNQVKPTAFVSVSKIADCQVISLTILNEPLGRIVMSVIEIHGPRPSRVWELSSIAIVPVIFGPTRLWLSSRMHTS